MKHFTTTPLSILAQRKPNFEKLRGAEFLPLWDEVFLHMCASHSGDTTSIPTTFEDVVTAIEEHRGSFRKALQQRRFTFRVLHAFCKGVPEKRLKALGSREGLIANMTVLVLDGKLDKFVRTLCDIIRYVVQFSNSLWC